MIACPCGQTIDQTCSWPPYRVATYDSAGNVIYAVCIHGCVVIDKRPNMQHFCCEKHMSYVDGWWLCTKCGRTLKDEVGNGD